MQKGKRRRSGRRRGRSWSVEGDSIGVDFMQCGRIFVVTERQCFCSCRSNYFTDYESPYHIIQQNVPIQRSADLFPKNDFYSLLLIQMNSQEKNQEVIAGRILTLRKQYTHSLLNCATLIPTNSRGDQTSTQNSSSKQLPSERVTDTISIPTVQRARIFRSIFSVARELQAAKNEWVNWRRLAR